MPYTGIRQVGDKFCITNKETGKKRCSNNYKDAVATLRVLQGLERGWKPTGKTGKGK